MRLQKKNCWVRMAVTIPTCPSSTWPVLLVATIREPTLSNGCFTSECSSSVDRKGYGAHRRLRIFSSARLPRSYLSGQHRRVTKVAPQFTVRHRCSSIHRKNASKSFPPPDGRVPVACIVSQAEDKQSRGPCGPITNRWSTAGRMRGGWKTNCDA